MRGPSWTPITPLTGSLLHADPQAQLVVADVNRTKVSAMVAAYGASAAEASAIVSADVDVFAPCALGASIDRQATRRLRAGVICGAANNQLASEADGELLARAGALYAPDFLVNAGGIVSVAGEYLGWSESEVLRRVDAIPDRLCDLLKSADADGVPPATMAWRAARSIIAAGVSNSRRSFTATAFTDLWFTRAAGPDAAACHGRDR